MTSGSADVSIEALIDECVGYITPRADWRSADAYPAPRSHDSTMWAWEFLRRNRVYDADFAQNQKGLATTGEASYAALAAATAWNISHLVNPAKSYELLMQSPPANEGSEFADDEQSSAMVFPILQPRNGKHPVRFAGTSAHVELPCFEPQEGQARGPGAFLNGRMRAATVHQMFMAANQVAVRITLDADIDAQLKDIRSALRDGHKTSFTTQYKRVLIVGEDPDAEPDAQEWAAYDYVLDRIKVRLDHLWLALRSVDAIQTIASNEVRPSELPELIRSQFNDESVSWRHIGPASKKSGKLLTRMDAERLLRYGLRYTLNGTYVRIASTDLSGQTDH